MRRAGEYGSHVGLLVCKGTDMAQEGPAGPSEQECLWGEGGGGRQGWELTDCGQLPVSSLLLSSTDSYKVSALSQAGCWVVEMQS